MVKIEGLAIEEKALIEKKSKLVEITKEFIGSDTSREITTTSGSIAIKHHPPQDFGYQLFIFPEDNTIHVESKLYLEEAVELAQLYEKAFPGEQFTVKKRYG